MTILDQFYLVFKSNAQDAVKDVDQYDKKLDNIHAKGKKRSEEEKKELEDTTKRQKEYGKQLEGSSDAADKLINGLAGVVAGYVSLSAIKAGIFNTADFNRHLSIQAKNLGQNTTDLRAYGAAVKAAGGDQEAFLSRVASKRIELAQQGLPFDMKSYYKGIREYIKGMDKTGQLAVFGTLGITDPGEMALLQATNEEFEKAIQGGYDLAQATKESDEASQKFGASLDNLKTQFTALWSTIDEIVLPSFTKFIEKTSAFAGLLKGGIDTARGKGSGHVWSDFTKRYITAEFQPIADKQRAERESRANPMVNQDALSFWMAKGFTRAQAIGIIAGGERSESNSNPNAIGDGGAARGAYQYHRDRRDAILAASGKDVWSSNINEAREGVAYEMSHGMRRGYNDAYFRTLTDPAHAAGYFTEKVESPRDLVGEMVRRGQMAMSMAAQIPFGASEAYGAPAKTTSVHIDQINVHTQATDAQGIAADIGDALHFHIRTTANSLDDGVNY